MNDKYKKGYFKWLIVGLFTIIISLLGILSNADPDAEYDIQHSVTTSKTVTIVLVDGLSKDIFLELIAHKKLPNLEKLVLRSTYVSNGIGSFPSMTGYAFYPFITGMDAPESGIYGLRWFDRTRDAGNLRNYVGRTNVQMNNDITDRYKNLFEWYDDFYTASINTYMNKGVKHSLKTGWAHTTAKYSGVNIFPMLRAIPFLGEDMSKDHFQHESLVTDLACKQLERNPKVQWITYPALDAHHHVHGTDDTYYKLIEHIDAEIGRLLKKIEDLEQKDRMVVVVSDHGVSDVETNLDIPGILMDSLQLKIEKGKSANLRTEELITPMQDFVECDGYFVINGNLSAYLYMTEPDTDGALAWRSKINGHTLTHYKTGLSEVNLPEFLSKIKGTDLVAYASKDSVITVLKNGAKATIHRKEDGKLAYIKDSGDPLEIGNLLRHGHPYSTDSLLSLTVNAAYPYAIARLWSLMSRKNSPDIVITTTEGYDLARNYEIFVDNYKGGHGGIHKNLLNVPYIMFVPGEKKRHVKVARAEDIGASIIDYLDLDVPYRLSGNSILSK